MLRRRPPGAEPVLPGPHKPRGAPTPSISSSESSGALGSPTGADGAGRGVGGAGRKWSFGLGTPRASAPGRGAAAGEPAAPPGEDSPHLSRAVADRALLARHPPAASSARAARAKSLSAPQLAAYARRLGAELPADRPLLPLVIELLTDPLPDGWSEEAAPDGSPVYVHRRSRARTPHHPSERYHRRLVCAEKWGDAPYVAKCMGSVPPSDDLHALRGLGPDGVAALVSDFSRYDRSRAGLISLGDFVAVARGSGLGWASAAEAARRGRAGGVGGAPSARQLRAAWELADADGSGDVDLNEFALALRAPSAERLGAEKERPPHGGGGGGGAELGWAEERAASVGGAAGWLGSARARGRRRHTDADAQWDAQRDAQRDSQWDAQWDVRGSRDGRPGGHADGHADGHAGWSPIHSPLNSSRSELSRSSSAGPSAVYHGRLSRADSSATSDAFSPRGERSPTPASARASPRAEARWGRLSRGGSSATSDAFSPRGEEPTERSRRSTASAASGGDGAVAPLDHDDWDGASDDGGGGGGGGGAAPHAWAARRPGRQQPQQPHGGAHGGAHGGGAERRRRARGAAARGSHDGGGADGRRSGGAPPPRRGSRNASRKGSLRPDGSSDGLHTHAGAMAAAVAAVHGGGAAGARPTQPPAQQQHGPQRSALNQLARTAAATVAKARAAAAADGAASPRAAAAAAAEPGGGGLRRARSHTAPRRTLRDWVRERGGGGGSGGGSPRGEPAAPPTAPPRLPVPRVPTLDHAAPPPRPPVPVRDAQPMPRPSRLSEGAPYRRAAGHAGAGGAYATHDDGADWREPAGARGGRWDEYDYDEDGVLSV